MSAADYGTDDLAPAPPYQGPMPEVGVYYRAGEKILPRWLVGRRLLVRELLRDRDVCEAPRVATVDVFGDGPSPEERRRQGDAVVYVVVRVLARGQLVDESVRPESWDAVRLGRYER